MFQLFLEKESEDKMDKRAVDEVSIKIYQRFPPLKGQRPKISKQGENQFLLVFSGSGKTPDGKTIRQTVRVVATDTGKILKTSMSR
jgi:hypothetical protein